MKHMHHNTRKPMILLAVCAALTFGIFGCTNSNTAMGNDNTVASTDTPTNVPADAPTAVPTEAPADTAPPSNFNNDKDIMVISREEGSGTRGAFIELFGIEIKAEDGTKVDHTTKEAVITNNTGVMMTNVTGDPYAIGYMSLGSVNETVKALGIEGIAATADNVKNGSYVVSRPFNIAVKGTLSEVAQDFVDYIMSKEGQAVVADSYIAIDDNAPAYAGSSPAGKIVVAGSSSVTPVMQKLREAYLLINANAQIEIQESDSTAGMIAAIDGNCDIGMASRELKDDEKEQLIDTQIALDGIAVVVNTTNPISNMTKEQVKSIFMGETVKWSEMAQ